MEVENDSAGKGTEPEMAGVRTVAFTWTSSKYATKYEPAFKSSKEIVIVTALSESNTEAY